MRFLKAAGIAVWFVAAAVLLVMFVAAAVLLVMAMSEHGQTGWDHLFLGISFMQIGTAFALFDAVIALQRRVDELEKP